MTFEQLLTEHASLVIFAAFLGALFYAAIDGLWYLVLAGAAKLGRRVFRPKAGV